MKVELPEYVVLVRDRVMHRAVGDEWVPVNMDGDYWRTPDYYYRAAVDGSLDSRWDGNNIPADGLYEVVGPNIGGNPHGLVMYQLFHLVPGRKLPVWA